MNFWQIIKNIQNIKFYKNPHPVGGVLFHVDRQTWTNRRDRANSNYSQFCDTCLKIGSYYSDVKSGKWAKDIRSIITFKLILHSSFFTSQQNLHLTTSYTNDNFCYFSVERDDTNNAIPYNPCARSSIHVHTWLYALL